jgi:hypothetical protein
MGSFVSSFFVERTCDEVGLGWIMGRVPAFDGPDL